MEFVFTTQSKELFKYQQIAKIAPAVQRLAGLGMNDNQIAVELGVDRKMVKKARGCGVCDDSARPSYSTYL